MHQCSLLHDVPYLCICAWLVVANTYPESIDEKYSFNKSNPRTKWKDFVFFCKLQSLRNGCSFVFLDAEAL